MVQMHCHARHFAARLEQELKKETSASVKIGAVLKYNNIFFGKFGDECVTVEEFIPGAFTKHINNAGAVGGDKESVICKKSECFAQCPLYL